MVRPAADHDAPFEQRLVGLEVREALAAELGEQRPAVEPEPGRLQVGDDPQPLHLLNRFQAHEIAMRNTGPAVPDWQFVVDRGISVDQRVHGAVANRVGGHLQVVFKRQLRNGPQLIGLDVEQPAVFRVGD